MKKHLTGFTIVELLVVIVVIGILAAITLVSYSSISKQAVVASIQSDLSNASTKLKMFLAENNIYPGSVTDCPNPASTNICLKSSPNNAYSYSVNNSSSPPTYSLSAVNGANIYQINSTSQTPTVLASAPLNPVADWLATATGDHYGNFYDLVTHSYATVTRSTTKTIYDPNTQKIYDVPANTLGIRPRSDGKSGVETEVEEGRTNTATYSSFETDSNYDGISDGYSQSINGFVGTLSSSLVDNSIYGTKGQRWVGSSTGIAGNPYLLTTNAQTGYSAGDNVTFSTYYTGSLNNVNLTLKIWAYDSSHNLLGQTTGTIYTPGPTYGRVSKTYTLPASSAEVKVGIYMSSIQVGSSWDVTFDAWQVERGNFATSYIPTAITAATRNSDNVNISTSSFNSDNGTLFVIAGDSAARGFINARSFLWGDSINRLQTYVDISNNKPFWANGINSNMFYPAITYSYTPGSYYTQAVIWSGTTVHAAMNGQVGNVNYINMTGTYSSVSMPAIAYLGSYMNSSSYYNGPIHRFTVYDNALSDANVLIATNAIKDGP